MIVSYMFDTHSSKLPLNSPIARSAKMSIFGTGGATLNYKKRVSLGVFTDFPLGLPPYLTAKNLVRVPLVSVRDLLKLVHLFENKIKFAKLIKLPSQIFYVD